MLNAKWKPRYESLRRESRAFDFLVRRIARPFMGLDSAAAASLLFGQSLRVALSHRQNTAQGRSDGRLRVLFLTAEGEAVAPARVRCYRFAEELRRRGHDAEVYSFWKDIWKVDGLPERHYFTFERFAAAIRAYEALKDRGFDVVYQQRPTYDLATTALMRWSRGTRVVFDIDDWIFTYQVLPPYHLHHVLTHMRHLSQTCVVSSQLLRDAVSDHFDDVNLLPTFVDTDAFRPRRERAPGPVVFGWNGTVFQDFMADSLRLLVGAFADAVERIRSRVEVVLDIVGQGAYLPEVERWFRSQYPGLPVRVRPWVDPARMNEYLDSVDVGLYALATQKSDAVAIHGRRGSEIQTNQLFLRSKSPTKVFEYMAKGVPVISTRLGEAAHVVDDGVSGILCDTHESFTAAFERLALEPKLRETMGNAARAQAEERYSLSRAGGTLESILRRVVQQG